MELAFGLIIRPRSIRKGFDATAELARVGYNVSDIGAALTAFLHFCPLTSRALRISAYVSNWPVLEVF